MNQQKTQDQGIKPGFIQHLTHDIGYNDDAIVSKTLRKSAGMNLTLFAFDTGQALSGHSTPMDAYVQILEGVMNITIADKTQLLNQGEMILMPAGINHALEAMSPTKLLLTMVSVSN